MTASGLLVDDNTPQLQACGRILNAWGMKADLATTVGEAEANAQSRCYDFALLDYAMPDSPNGPRSLIHKLRAKSPSCKIFLVTAYRGAAFDNLSDLNVPVLDKPVDWRELRNVLDPSRQS